MVGSDEKKQNNKKREIFFIIIRGSAESTTDKMVVESRRATSGDCSEFRRFSSDKYRLKMNISLHKIWSLNCDFWVSQHCAVIEMFSILHQLCHGAVSYQFTLLGLEILSVARSLLRAGLLVGVVN